MEYYVAPIFTLINLYAKFTFGKALYILRFKRFTLFAFILFTIVYSKSLKVLFMR